MPIFPVRGLSQKGVLADPLPAELDLNAWSKGRNVRFHANVAERAPIFRDVLDPFPDTPAFCVGRRLASTGVNGVIGGGAGGRLWNYSAGSASEVTPVAGGITSLYLTSNSSGGSGYTAAPAVTIGAPPAGGTQATATATVSGGSVIGFTITNPGAGYLYGVEYSVTVAAPTSGTTATAAASAVYVPGPGPRAYTATFLGDVVYINRPGAPPAYLGPAGTQFAALPGWDATWSCRSLRAFGNYLVALNVTKGAAMLDNLVKWSDLTLAGLPPGSWNADDPTTSAGENPLEQLSTPIVDGAPMRSYFVIYSENEIWSMEPIDNIDIFYFRRLFGDGGMIAPNCVAEVNGLHYVFGQNDIYVHDGVLKRSIIDGRNRNRVFNYLNLSQSESFFVSYFAPLNQVWFAYSTAHPDAAYTGMGLCNEAAVYDVVADTWSFIDLPNVGAASTTLLAAGMTYATAAATYESVGGTYFTLDGSPETNIVAVSQSGGTGTNLITQNRLLAYDFYSRGLLAFPYLAEASMPPTLQRTGLDLDQIGADITTAKLVRRLYPFVETFDGEPLQMAVGGQMLQSGPLTWSNTVTFDPTSQYKIDLMQGGRYLAFQVSSVQPSDFSISGFDVDVVQNGSR